MLTTREAAKRLAVSVGRIHQLISEARLPAEKFGRDFIIKEADLRLVADRKPGRPKGKKAGQGESTNRATCASGASVSGSLTVDELRESLRSLSDKTLSELLESLQLKPERGLTVTIYDGQQWQGNPDTRPEDIDRPRAMIVFGPRHNVTRQEIDIFASIRKDAANIAHPAIICAIRFWQGSIICRGQLSGMGPGHGSRLSLSGETAEGHLKTLGDILLDASRENQWSAPYAFDFYRTTGFNSYYYLKLVFDAYKSTRKPDADKLIEIVRTKLQEDEKGIGEDGEPYERSGLTEDALKILDIGFDHVRDFLKTIDGKHCFKRCQWETWKNSYDEWRFSLTGDVQRRYRGTFEAVEVLLTGAEGKLIDRNGTMIGLPVAPYPDRNNYSVSATHVSLNLPVVLIDTK